MGSARINAIRQRLADSTYGGMGKFRKQGTKTSVSDAVGTFMHDKFNEPNTRSEIMDNVLEDDKECKDEATCGQSSRFLKKKWDTQEYGDMGVKVKEIGGTYVGPGAEHSQAGYSNKGKPEVGHEWLELPDESIVDASAGQFINPKHKPLKQRQRFRIIPKESGLHKYYKKDELLQNMIDTKEGREKIKRSRKALGFDDDTTPEGMKQVKLPNGKIVTVPDRMAKSARIQTARQRLADIFDVIEGGKIKDVKYFNDPPVDKPYYKRFYMKPRTFLDTAAGGAGRKRQKAVTDAHSDPAGSSDRNINRLAIEDHLKWVDYPKNKDIREMTNKEKIDLSMTDDINYNVRGDELGGVEYYKRKLRRGDTIGEPSFTFATPSKNEGRKRILGHEGRHRAKALLEEGVKRIPVKVVGYSGGVVEKNLGNRKKLKGAVEYEPGHLKSDKDTRYPILGRYSKSARIQMARERLGRVGKVDWETALREQTLAGDPKTDWNTFSGNADFISSKGEMLGRGVGQKLWHNVMRPDGPEKATHIEQLMNVGYNPHNLNLERDMYDQKREIDFTIDDFMKETNSVRARGTKDHIDIDSNHPLTRPQIKTINNHIQQYKIPIEKTFVTDYTPNKILRKQLGLPSVKKIERQTHTQNLAGKLRQRLGAVGKVKRILKDESKVDVAPERVLSSEAESNIAGIELQDLSGETTELQKRTLNRGLKPKPLKKRSEFSSSEEAIKYLKRVNDPVRIQEENADDFERMRSQYISEDNIKKNKWAKLRQRIGAIGNTWESLAEKYATPITHKEHQTHSWLSPSGKFYDLDEFGNSEHQQWIKTLLDKHGDKNLLKQYSRPEEESLGEGFEDDMDEVAFMEDSNFIRLNTDGYKELNIGTGNEPTKAQIKSIQDLAILRGYKSDNIIVDGYYPDTEENYVGEKQLRRRMGLHKLGKLRQRIGMMIDGKWIDDAEVMANPKKYGLKPFKQDKPFKWNPPRDPEHEAWVKEQYDNFDKVVGDIKAHNEDVKTEKESYESSVIRKPGKHRPKKPTQQDRIDVMEARLRQRIAEIGRPKQFNFKETLNKHWKLAAKDPRFKAFTHSSSFVGNVKYDQDEQSMQIILNGKTYDFCNVEERLFDSFSGAGSKGAFFNREIKSLHNCGAW